MSWRDELLGCIVLGKVDDAPMIVQKALKEKTDPRDILKVMSKALEVVGKKYETGEYFLMDLMLSGNAMVASVDALKPELTAQAAKSGYSSAGKVVLGTVKGDLHDIGKNIVKSYLTGAGFEVIDLGVDVPTERFVQSVRENNARLVCMSALMSFTMYEMKKVIDALEQQGLRKSVKVLVGGRPTSKKFAEEIGADGWADDAVEAIPKAKKLVGK